MHFLSFLLVDSIKARVTLDCVALWDTALSTDRIHLEPAVFPCWISLPDTSIRLAPVRALGPGSSLAWCAARSRRQITESPLTQTWKRQDPVAEKCGRNIAPRVAGEHLKHRQEDSGPRHEGLFLGRAEWVSISLHSTVARLRTAYPHSLNWTNIILTCGISL